MNTNITAAALRRAATIKDQIELLEAEYNAILSGGSVAGASAPTARRGRPPGVKRGRKAARKAGRPAAAAAESTNVATKKRGRRKRKLSPEARARIVAAVKARWAREKGQA
jgi:hypothetical protein